MVFMMEKNFQLSIMKYNWLIILVLSVFLIESCAISKKSIEKDGYNVSEIIDLEVDKLGNYYTINSLGEISKYSSENKILSSYGNSNYGVLSTLDVTNPHKILVFYQEQQIILLLDNSLSEIGKIELDNNSEFTAVGYASDGNIWIYDTFLNRLKKINSYGESLEESLPSNTIVPNKIVGAKIIDRGNYVILVDEVEGILLFSNLGYFERTLRIFTPIKPKIINGYLYYFDKKTNTYLKYDIRLNEKAVVYSFDKLSTKPKLVIFENDYFYLLRNDKINQIPIK